MHRAANSGGVMRTAWWAIRSLCHFLLWGNLDRWHEPKAGKIIVLSVPVLTGITGSAEMSAAFEIADGRICFQQLGSYRRGSRTMFGFRVQWRRAGARFRLHPKAWKCLSRDHAKHRMLAHTRMKKVK